MGYIKDSRRYKKIPLTIQERLLKKNFPDSITKRNKESSLFWVGQLKPTSLSKVYTILVHLKNNEIETFAIGDVHGCIYTLMKLLEKLPANSKKIFVGDLRARNICCKILKNKDLQLIVIDGIGHRDFFPLADWFHYFAKKKVERRFLKGNLHSLEAQRGLIKRMRAAGETIV